jgi:acyl carrier protein
VVLEDLEMELAASLARELSLQPGDVDIDLGFIEIGLDSIVSVEWVRTLNRDLGLNITASKVYDHPNVREFARYLRGEILKARGRRPPSPVKPLVAERVRAPVEKRELDVVEVEAPAPAPAPAEPDIVLEDLQAELAVSLARELSLQPHDVDIDAGFIDVGLDSIVSVEWVQSLNRAYGLNITASKVYDHSSVREFARYLRGEIVKARARRPPARPRALSVDEVLLRVQRGELDAVTAGALLATPETEQGERP